MTRAAGRDGTGEDNSMADGERGEDAGMTAAAVFDEADEADDSEGEAGRTEDGEREGEEDGEAADRGLGDGGEVEMALGGASASGTAAALASPVALSDLPLRRWSQEGMMGRRRWECKWAQNDSELRLCECRRAGAGDSGGVGGRAGALRGC